MFQDERVIAITKFKNWANDLIKEEMERENLGFYEDAVWQIFLRLKKEHMEASAVRDSCLRTCGSTKMKSPTPKHDLAVW